jgi:hypothetical protein
VCNWDHYQYLAQTSSHVVACITAKSNLQGLCGVSKSGGYYGVYLVIVYQMFDVLALKF